MNTNNYLPFNLETALKHPERVVTRDGRKVEQFIYFKNKTLSNYTVYANIGDDVYTYTINGEAIKDELRERDLVLLPEVKECWVNVYETNAGFIDIGGICHMTKQNAIDGRNQDQKYIKTIRITNEPE